ncbi:MAG: hypothetical protein K6F99_02180, partial [Lachnospiraceae bacterium]|nr:hypothetical protein [Lachnospiraceae bacterium]
LGLDKDYIEWLESFVDAESTGDFYAYSDFESSWGGWQAYEDAYGCNISNGSCGVYAYDYGDEYYEDSDDDWIYDYESGLWYTYDEDGLLYLYDEEIDTYYIYDEEYDETYYYDENDDEWYLYDE